MEFVYYLLLSVVSGVLAGMGMGGGTLLIPMLTLIMGVEQQLAQATNLLVFVPCAVVVCIIYAKDKLIDFKSSWLISVVAGLVSIVAVLVAVKIKNEILSICFGVFLILLGVVQFIIQLVNELKKKDDGYIKRKDI